MRFEIKGNQQLFQNLMLTPYPLYFNYTNFLCTESELIRVFVILDVFVFIQTLYCFDTL